MQGVFTAVPTSRLLAWHLFFIFSGSCALVLLEKYGLWMQKGLIRNQSILLALFTKKGKFSCFPEPVMQARKDHEWCWASAVAIAGTQLGRLAPAHEEKPSGQSALSTAATEPGCSLGVWLVLPPCDKLQQSQARNPGWTSRDRQGQRDSPTLIPPENPSGLPWEIWRLRQLRKTHRWDMSPAPREADPNWGWESHEGRWVWGPRKIRRWQTPRKPSPPLLGHPGSRALWGVMSQGSRAGSGVQSQMPWPRPHGAATLRPPVLQGSEQAPLTPAGRQWAWRLHLPLGPCLSGGWVLPHSLLNVLWDVGLFFTARWIRLDFIYSLFTRGGSPEPLRSGKHLGCRHSTEQQGVEVKPLGLDRSEYKVAPCMVPHVPGRPAALPEQSSWSVWRGLSQLLPGSSGGLNEKRVSPSTQQWAITGSRHPLLLS